MIEILESMKNNNIEPKKIQFVYPKNGGAVFTNKKRKLNLVFF